MKSFGSEVDFLLSRARRPGPGEGANLKSFGEHADAGAVKVKSFEPNAPLVCEEEQSSAFEAVGLELFGDSSEPVEGLAHVASFNHEADAQVVGESHHERPPFATILLERTS